MPGLPRGCGRGFWTRRRRAWDPAPAADPPGPAHLVFPVLPRGNRPRPRAQGGGGARHRVGGTVPDRAAVRAGQPPAARDAQGRANRPRAPRRSRPRPGSSPTAAARRRSPRVTRCSGSPRRSPARVARRRERRSRARDGRRHPRRGAAAAGIVAAVRRFAVRHHAILVSDIQRRGPRHCNARAQRLALRMLSDSALLDVS